VKVGVFTPLLSHLPLAEVLKKPQHHHIDTVELGTGNYPGDAHCKLEMLDDAPARAALAGSHWTEHARFAADHGVKIAIEMHPGFLVYSLLPPEEGLSRAAAFLNRIVLRQAPGASRWV
jgi:sugar phosphate isomerase/epimerase